MTLEEVKERIAEESLYRDWVTFINDQPNWKVEEIMDEVAKRYALEAIKADRERMKDEIKIHQAIYVSKGFYHPAENLIDNLPIELK